ncbi:ABC transporter ATP-binding protein [Geobacter sp. FeAm09]|uniref:ABC transporter ATP-binding protein n=1 Tax=Geobacter sp. FeAm09 TaxID=2597769 RepID=UPI00197AA505|nr:ABC transporter ATP-binding protein [Geobacter sp. FeAm09]
MALIDTQHLSFSYRRQAVLTDIDLSVAEGSVLALLGPNGSGKTTLLKLMTGLLKPVRGHVRLNDRDIHTMPQRELARNLAYVPQVHRETFAYRVVDVVLMGRMPHKSFFSRYGAADRLIAHEALEKLGIAHLADRPYTEVSGGERQLALIARAMTQGARAFIMDEPTNGLDYGNQVRLLERLKALAADGYTFVFSTHHPDHALAVADRVVMMRKGVITHDGVVGDTVTQDSLMDLYNVDVRMYPVENGVCVCVPAVRLCGCGGKAH